MTEIIRKITEAITGKQKPKAITGDVIQQTKYVITDEEALSVVRSNRDGIINPRQSIIDAHPVDQDSKSNL